MHWKQITGSAYINPLSRARSRLLGSHIKKALMASECGHDDVKRMRREWITLRQTRMRRKPHRLVSIDETGSTTKMIRLRGRSKRGERLPATASFGHWKTQTFIAALRHGGLTAPLGD